MQEPFRPPGIKTLAQLDQAQVNYRENIEIIEGIVGPESQCGWQGKDESYDIQCFTLAAWRRIGQTLTNTKLVVLLPIRPKSLRFDDFPECKTLRLCAIISDDDSRAIVDSFIAKDFADSEFQAIAEQILKPVVFESPELGLLRLNRSIEIYEGSLIWCGEWIDVMTPARELKPTSQAQVTAEALLASQQTWHERVLRHAAEELLPGWAEDWREEDEPEISKNEFMKRLTLTSIQFTENGRFEFWFNDDDLFGGHAIVVEGNLQTGPTSSYICG